MARKPPQTVIMLALGAGQTIAFASSFYLLGVMGDDIAADLRLAPTFVFSLMSVALTTGAVLCLVMFAMTFGLTKEPAT
ncbi:hypothetical protein JKL49_09470 [Phenylobacterium sp. 20VBR1]|uniref:Uncharacterized protein n=2 Tax=Phenylobacterium glaciei TaxID=2803784 RepID=A0A941CZM2_9CAUL|nr:hypothetical protein [Phenylobacterium glaciei]MBR7619615.1 hypothetical protein [Phenylobacterium glaciei]